jgi:hypothetical protein
MGEAGGPGRRAGVVTTLTPASPLVFDMTTGSREGRPPSL